MTDDVARAKAVLVEGLTSYQWANGADRGKEWPQRNGSGRVWVRALSVWAENEEGQS